MEGVEAGAEWVGVAELGTTAPPRDLTPAMHYAAARRDMAIEHIDTRDDGTRLYHLVTLRNESVLVRVRCAGWPADDRTPTPLNIEARVGRFGDPDRERALIRTLISRLRELSER